jgi:hypothetical protein
MFFILMLGQDQYMRTSGFTPNLLRSMDAIEQGHGYIHYYDIGPELADKFYSLASIIGFCNHRKIRLLLQERTNALPQDGVIIYQKDSNFIHLVYAQTMSG